VVFAQSGFDANFLRLQFGQESKELTESRSAKSVDEWLAIR
jgi:hypothetical protein